MVLVSTIGGGCIEMDSNSIHHPIVAAVAVDGCRIARTMTGCCSAETTRGEKRKDVGAPRFRPDRVHGSIGCFGSRMVLTNAYWHLVLLDGDSAVASAVAVGGEQRTYYAGSDQYPLC